MSSQKKLLLALALLPILVYAGLKGFLYYKTKEGVEQIITMARPFATISYEGIDSTLGGVIGLIGVKIQPVNLNDGLKIQSLDVQTPGLGFLLFGVRQASSGEIPERLRLSLRGLSLNMTGQLMGLIEDLQRNEQDPPTPPGLLNCGKVSRLTSREYTQLGYSQMVLDLGFGFEYDKRRQHADLKFDWAMRDAGAMTGSITLDGIAPQLLAAGGQPKLGPLRLEYRDRSFTEKLKHFCAKEAGLTPDQYVEAEVGVSDARFLEGWGFVPGPGLRAAYRDFLQHPERIEVEIEFPSDMDPTHLGVIQPENLLSMVHLDLSVNGKPVTDMSFSRHAATSAPPPTATPSKPKVTSKPKSFQPVEIADLNKYRGQAVKVYTKQKMVREGVLTQVEANEVAIERRLARGSITITVSVHDIERVEVFL